MTKKSHSCTDKGDPIYIYPVPIRHGGINWNGANIGSFSRRLLHRAVPWANASDTAAILEWGLDDPFIPQDRPPLSFAMLATVDGVRCLRRYRLVVAQKSKLHLASAVATALASQTTDHRLTASGFFPVPLTENFCMAMQQMAIDPPCGYVPPMMEMLYWCTV